VIEIINIRTISDFVFYFILKLCKNFATGRNLNLEISYSISGVPFVRFTKELFRKHSEEIEEINLFGVAKIVALGEQSKRLLSVCTLSDLITFRFCPNANKWAVAYFLVQ